jgi:hypothetical protein
MSIKKWFEWQKNPKIELNLKMYHQKTVKVFLDMIYGVNTNLINMKTIIDLIHLIYDCDHYDEKGFKWHFDTLNFICKTIDDEFKLFSEDDKEMLIRVAKEFSKNNGKFKKKTQIICLTRKN